MTNDQIDAYLYGKADEDYKVFNSRLNLSKMPQLGVRMPDIDRLAKTLAKDGDYFLRASTDTYEHVMLYGSAIAKTRLLSREQKWERFTSVMRLIDSWAHVDCIVARFKEFGSDREFYYPRLAALKTGSEFERRVLIVSLMTYYMTAEDLDETYRLVKECECDAPYVIKAEGWLISVGLAKFYDRTFEYVKSGYFCKAAHNLGIQKARESFRVSNERKKELDLLKIK